jgi:hypothetical protein
MPRVTAATAAIKEVLMILSIVDGRMPFGMRRGMVLG